MNKEKCECHDCTQSRIVGADKDANERRATDAYILLDFQKKQSKLATVVFPVAQPCR